MKKLLSAFVVIFISAASLFAWEPKDLTKFPPGMDAKSWILNLGIGLSNEDYFKKDHIYILPLRLSLDRNVAMGDNNLPFFIGGILGYSGHGYKNDWNDWFRDEISVGGRFGYHFNWGVNNLDTYAFTTAGIYIDSFRDKKYSDNSIVKSNFFWGVNLGARYFLNKWFGFWAETGFTYNVFIVDIGLAFKF